MEQISVAKALTKIKTNKKLIEKAISEGVPFVEYAKKSASKVDNVRSREEYAVDVKAKHQSIIDLMEVTKKLKAKVVESNANTIVTIAGVKMTKADAIERKNSIEFERALLNKMKEDYNKAIAHINSHNEDVQIALDKMLENSFNSDKKADTSSIEAITKTYKDTNEYEIINPLNLQVLIAELEKSIDDFMQEVDSVLVESNVICKIEI